ncbi:hypothetical protein D915_009812 [Fasciola hepatica]|uniref:Uncharacterized protein n=1 Tax=Fasciola hepatica TaxID=6192 RepID=A0A4E0QYX3_FASHE|nr:hypothetical protein D915_009812 [Fasciola hepatica]
MDGAEQLAVKCSHNYRGKEPIEVGWQVLYSTFTTERIRLVGPVLQIDPGNTFDFVVCRCNLWYQNDLLNFLTYVQIVFPAKEKVGVILFPQRTYLHPDELVIFTVELTPSLLPPLIRRRLEAHLNLKITTSGEPVYYQRGSNLFPRARLREQAGKNITFDIYAYFFYSTIRVKTNYTLKVLARPTAIFNWPSCTLLGYDSETPWDETLHSGSDVRDLFHEHITWPYSYERSIGMYRCTRWLPESQVHGDQEFHGTFSAPSSVIIGPKNRRPGDHLQCLVFNWRSPDEVIPGEWILVQDELSIYKLDGASIKFQGDPPQKVSLIYKCCGNYQGEIIWTTVQMILDQKNYSYDVTPQWVVVYQDTNQTIPYISKQIFGSDAGRLMWYAEPVDPLVDQIATFDLSEPLKKMEIRPLDHVYTKVGSQEFRINISDVRTGHTVLQTNITVIVLPNHVTGTVDGILTHPQVKIFQNDNPPLECGLIPSVDQLPLHGYWRAYVNGEETEIVRINHTSGRALVEPPLDMTAFKVTGRAEVVCRFYTEDGNLLFDFNRSVEVITMPDIKVVFEPPDGVLFVGEKNPITCIRNISEEFGKTSIPIKGAYSMSQLDNCDDLLSLTDGTDLGEILPPRSHSTYPEVGSCLVHCEYFGHNQVLASGNILVKILRKYFAKTKNAMN